MPAPPGDAICTWKMNVSTWKMNGSTWKMNADSWNMNANTWKMSPLCQEWMPAPGDNVPVFLYLWNSDHFLRPSVIKQSNRRRFCFGMTHTIKHNMTHWTPKNPLIVLKIRPIPPSAHGVSFTIWHLCHCLSTGCATVLLPPSDRIDRQANRRGMMGRNWVCFRTFDLRI